ncbi:MAG: hypothetical protein ACK5RG_11305 [Cyclobacteriaceae bacterium]|jgi:hypothetical protein|nr:hypothetical protein [Flammeovirgaceae bacterium]
MRTNEGPQLIICILSILLITGCGKEEVEIKDPIILLSGETGKSKLWKVTGFLIYDSTKYETKSSYGQFGGPCEYVYTFRNNQTKDLIFYQCNPTYEYQYHWEIVPGSPFNKLKNDVDPYREGIFGAEGFQETEILLLNKSSMILRYRWVKTSNVIPVYSSLIAYFIAV